MGARRAGWVGPVAGAAQVGGGTNAGWASLAGAGRAGTGRENRLGAGGPGRGVVGCCTNAIAVGEAGVPLRTPFAASFSTSFIAFVFPTILQDFAGGLHRNPLADSIGLHRNLGGCSGLHRNHGD